MIIVGCLSHKGIKRKEHTNQDAYATCLPGVFNRRPPMVVVADGMGGYHGGEIASQLVVKTIKDYYIHADWRHENMRQIIKKSIYEAHKAVIEYASKHDHRFSQMGSTVVVAVIQERKIILGNVGDSRAYLINQ